MAKCTTVGLPTSPAPLSRWGLNLILLLGSCVVAFAVAEIALRIVRPVSTVAYRLDADLGYRLGANQETRAVSQDYDVVIRTNSAGFHDVEHALAKPSDVYRIVVLGESFVEALELGTEDGFTQQLERRVQAWTSGKRVEVINLGISGTGPAQYYRVLELQGLKYQPDLVIMAVLPDNDFRDSYQALGGAISKPYYRIEADNSLRLLPPHVSDQTASVRFLLQKSAFLQLVRKAVVALPVEEWLGQVGLLAPFVGVKIQDSPLTIPPDWFVYVAEPPASWQEAYRVTLRMVEEAAKLANRHQARFLVMTIGSTATVEDRWAEALASYPDAGRVRWEFDRPERAIAGLGERVGFDVINLVEPFRRDYAV
ncbi:MAG: hypothetical protein E8D45_07625, partial [Nitrospira sp.]